PLLHGVQMLERVSNALREILDIVLVEVSCLQVSQDERQVGAQLADGMPELAENEGGHLTRGSETRVVPDRRGSRLLEVLDLLTESCGVVAPAASAPCELVDKGV